MSPAKCCILCVLHSSRKRTSLFLKSCIQILDLYRQFLQNQHHKKKCFFFEEKQKNQKIIEISQKKMMPPPPNKDFETSILHSFLVFPSRRFVFCVFFCNDSILFDRIHRRWSSPRRWHTPWRSLRRWRPLYLDGNGEEVGVGISKVLRFVWFKVQLK